MSKRLTAYSIFALLWLAFLLWFTWGYWEDDAFIHLEFASSFYEGKGFSFNGLTAYGDTSPAWVFMLVIFYHFIQDWYIAGKILALLGVIFAISGMFLYVRRITAPDPRSNEIAAISTLLILINPYFIFWAFSGMEAVTAFGLIFWLLYLILPPAPSSPNQLSENSSDFKVLTKLGFFDGSCGARRN